jgi:hypothetical protein
MAVFLTYPEIAVICRLYGSRGKTLSKSCALR